MLIQQQLVESVPLTEMKAFSQMSYFRTSIDLLGTSRSQVAKFRVYRLGERFKKRWPSTATPATASPIATCTTKEGAWTQ